ncbi:hypothetical protein SISSUDRAFT_880551 [Sistotremastrum suecicum HHB10207 ss-3]|uniref:Uncharacterized protein n=1 Tax=Sistotremastrum suecicum HHB10207 ss-3 TaxID=1314776 RepID=A0A166C7E7_9AGAM|nr:hypothetical protein SISSUDRAFT_880551 [Sistotremastrum suecicum HHB10207 ss-3]
MRWRFGCVVWLPSHGVDRSCVMLVDPLSPLEILRSHTVPHFHRMGRFIELRSPSTLDSPQQAVFTVCLYTFVCSCTDVHIQLYSCIHQRLEHSVRVTRSDDPIFSSCFYSNTSVHTLNRDRICNCRL